PSASPPAMRIPTATKATARRAAAIRGGMDTLKGQVVPTTGHIHLYYSENIWFTLGISDYTPIYVGTLRENGYVYRAGSSVHISKVERRVSKFGTPDTKEEWDAWFKENNQEPPDPSSLTECWRKEFGGDL